MRRGTMIVALFSSAGFRLLARSLRGRRFGAHDLRFIVGLLIFAGRAAFVDHQELILAEPSTHTWMVLKTEIASSGVPCGYISLRWEKIERVLSLSTGSSAPLMWAVWARMPHSL